jgi:hypothetical protein
MNIDKKELRLGIWYEDKEGNMYRNDDYSVEKPNEKIVTRHVCFPTEINERIEQYYSNKDTCRHPLRFRKRTYGWIKGIKGCKCTKCGKEKVGKLYIPFALMKWDNGNDAFPILTTNYHLGKSTRDCVVAMVNSGDYELDEALCIMANSCERCMNVLLYQYLNGKDGYEEYSEEWKKCNTVCDFCK